MFKTIPKNAGFSMLEMLIALLVLSVGLLGVATLQIRGQQFTQVGYLRTQAAFLAYDIMERMRINSDDVVGNGNADDAAYNFNSNSPPPFDDCDNNACTPAQLVNYDLGKWYAWVAETLPESEVNIVWTTEDTDDDRQYAEAEDTIVENGRLDSFYTITIKWANIIDRDDDAAQEEQQWTLQVQL